MADERFESAPKQDLLNDLRASMGMAPLRPAEVKISVFWSIDKEDKSKPWICQIDIRDNNEVVRQFPVVQDAVAWAYRWCNDRAIALDHFEMWGYKAE